MTDQTELTAGYALDERVIRQVLHWPICAPRLSGPYPHIQERSVGDFRWWVLFEHAGDGVVFSPSTDIKSAWRVWTNCLTTYGQAAIYGDMEDYGREPGDVVWVEIGMTPDVVRVLGPAPLAICRAALLMAARCAA